MWALAAGVSQKYTGIQKALCREARRHLQLDEIDDDGKDVEKAFRHCQAWILITYHEFKLLSMRKAWISAGRAVRLAQMLGLDRLDSETNSGPQTIPSAVIGLEEQRRTFWMMFWADRCASMGSGWPIAISEDNVSTVRPGHI